MSDIPRGAPVTTPDGAGTVRRAIRLVNGETRYIVQFPGKPSEQYRPEQVQLRAEAA